LLIQKNFTNKRLPCFITDSTLVLIIYTRTMDACFWTSILAAPLFLDVRGRLFWYRKLWCGCTCDHWQPHHSISPSIFGRD